MPKTPDAILKLYDQIKSANANTGWECAVTVTTLMDLGTLVWKVDDVGIICMIPNGPRRAHVHIFFWDRRLRGREKLCKQFGLWLMDSYELDTLWTAIPIEAEIIRAFARRVGFKYIKMAEGRQILAATRWSLHDAKQRSVNHGS